MKVRTISALFVCLALLSAVSLAAAREYQTGKIIKVEKRESHAPSGGTDAPTTAEATTYHISIQLGDKVYVCRYQAGPDSDLTWVEGKDVQARVSGKALYVKKANGKETKGSILSTSPAGNS